jgi:hypothetical protein
LNLSQIYAGNDYAHYGGYMPRGSKFHERSKRVRAVKAYKKFEYGRQNASGFVEVLDIDADGEIVSEQTREVKARDIISTWEEHEDEFERAKIEKARREREYRERQEREYHERQRIEAEREHLYSELDALGISREKVQLGVSTVTLNKTLFVEMLNELRAKGFKTGNGQPTSRLEEHRAL